MSEPDAARDTASARESGYRRAYRPDAVVIRRTRPAARDTEAPDDPGASSASDERVVARRLATLGDHDRKTVDFGSRVDSIFKRATGTAPRPVHGMVVGVEANDGMSTLARETAERAMALGIPHHHIEAGGTGFDLHQLFNSFDLSLLVRRAREHEILPRKRVIDRRRAWLIAGGLVIVAVIAAVISGLSGTGPLTVSGCVAAGLLAAVAILANALQRSDEGNRMSVAELVEMVRAEDMGARADAMMAAIARDYQRVTKPRCTVIDDYSRLDPLVRHFVDEYLDAPTPKDPTGDIWFVFDRHGAGQNGPCWTASVKAATQAPHQDPSHRRRNLLPGLSVPNLTAEQRRSLAVAVGSPDRARYPTVGAICRGVNTDSVQPFVDGVERALSRGDRDVVGVLHLLALTATRGANLRWESKDLVELLTRNLKTRRAFVLAALFPDVPPTARDRGLDLFAELFDPRFLGLDGDPENSIHLRLDVSECLLDNADRWGLPRAGLGHLFWGLFWHDFGRHRVTDALYVDKVGKHLLDATLPRHVPALAEHSDELTQQLFEGIVAVIDAGLSCCCLADTRALVQRAVHIAAEDRADGARKRRLRLRRLAWDAYAVLGDDRILDAILELETLLAGRTDQSPTVADNACRSLYFASLGKVEPRRLAPPSGKKLAGSGAVTEAHVRLSGAWLALSSARFVRGERGPLQLAAVESLNSIASEVAVLVQDEQENWDEWDELDCIALSSGLWCWMLQLHSVRVRGSRGTRALEGLADAMQSCVVAVENYADRTVHNASSAFVASGLEQDLLLTLLTLGLVVFGTAASDLDADDRATIVEVMSIATTRLGLIRAESQTTISTDQTIDAVLGRMELLQGAWHNLGFEQLASHLALRRVQLMTMFDISPDVDDDGTIELLADEFGRTDRRGLLARIVAAEADHDTTIMEAVHLHSAAVLAIQGTPDEELVAELCRIAVEAGHAYDFEWDEILDFVLTELNGTYPWLEATFAQAASHELPALIEHYLNIADNRTSDERGGDSAWDRIAGVTQTFLRDLPPETQVEVDLTVEKKQVQRAVTVGRPVAVQRVLDHWTEHRSRSGYSHLLYLLCRADGAFDDTTLAAEIDGVLQTYRSRLTSTGILLLVWRLVDIGRRVDANLLPDALRSWAAGPEGTDTLYVAATQLDHLMQPADNVEIFSYLAKEGFDHAADAAARRDAWFNTMIEFDQAQKLHAYLESERFVLLFRYWVRVLSRYGLSLDGSDGGPAPADSGQLLTRVDALPGAVPRTSHGLRVSTQFLVDSAAAFAADRPVDSNTLEARQLLEERARVGLPRLFDAMKELHDVPEPILTIVRRHQALVVQRIQEGDGQLVRRGEPLAAKSTR